MPARAVPGRDQRTFTEAARREQIVAAAVETLATLGYADTSLGKIARTAGLSSVGMISYYFAGKAELMSEVVTTVLGEAQETVAPRVAAAPDAVERFRTYVEATLEFVATRRAQAVALMEITLGRRSAAEFEQDASAVVRDLVVRAQAQLASEGGSDREPVDPDLVVVAVRGAVDHAVVRSLRRRPGSGPDPELAAEGPRLAELFTRAL